MEPFSIYELTSTVLKLSLKLYKFFRAVHDAPEEIQEYLSVLESIRRVFQDVQEYATLHQQSAFALQDGVQLRVVETVLKDCELEFALQLSYIEKIDPSSISSFFARSEKRIEWVLRKETVEGLTRKLENLQALLAMAVTTSTGKNGVAIRQRLELLGLEVHDMHEQFTTEAADRQLFFVKVQQFMTDLQRSAGLYMQFAGEAHMRSDSRLSDVTEALATAQSSLATKPASEIKKSISQSEKVANQETVPAAGLSHSMKAQSTISFKEETQDFAYDSLARNLSTFPAEHGSLQTVIDDAFQHFREAHQGTVFPLEDIRSPEGLQALMTQAEGRLSLSRTRQLSRVISTLSGLNHTLADFSSIMNTMKQVAPGTMSLFSTLSRLLINATQEDMASLFEAMEEMSDAIMTCQREVELYEGQKLYVIVKKVYCELLEATSLCIQHYKLSGWQTLRNRGTFRPEFESRINRIRKLSDAVLREVDYLHRREMRDTSSRVVAMQVEQHKILGILEDQKRVLQSLQEERKIMSLVHEQQKILQTMQQIQATLQQTMPEQI